MRRALHVMEGLGPQEAYYYDHPFFGQLFLGSMLMVIGYPQSLSPSQDLDSIGSLYEVPRTLMGILAIIDTFLLPFLLSSILLAVHIRSSKSDRHNARNNISNNILIVISGLLLGIAIFTKVPAFTIIPLVALLIYRNNGRRFRPLGMWFIPVIAIPLIWPAQSLVVGAFNSWTNDVLWQINRENAGLPWIVFLLASTDRF